MSVSMKPGATTLTVMLRDAYSRAIELGRAEERRLGRGVGRLPDVAHLADDARHEDDPAPAAAHHAPARGAGAGDGAADVGRPELLEVLVLEAQEQAVDGDAGVGDEDVELAVALDDAVDRGVDRLGVGDVEARDSALPPAATIASATSRAAASPLT